MSHHLEPAASDLPFGLFSFLPANAEDVDAIVPLLLDASDGLYEYLLDDIDGLPVETWLRRFISSASSPYGLANWRLCLLEESVVGAICLCPALLLGFGEPRVPLTDDRLALIESFLCVDEASYHVVSLAVSEPYRDQGIGATLLAWAAAEGKSQGYDSLSLFVRTDNERALKFYRRHSFNIVRQTATPKDCFLPASHLLTRTL